MKTLLAIVGVGAVGAYGYYLYKQKKNNATPVQSSVPINDLIAPKPPAPNAADDAFKAALKSAHDTITLLSQKTGATNAITAIEAATINGFISDCGNQKSQLIQQSLNTGIDLKYTILYCANEKYRMAFGKYLMMVPHNNITNPTSGKSSFTNYLPWFPSSKNNFIGPVTDKILKISVLN